MIELFPASSLDNSILTSVWVGLMVTWLLQERLGWEFTGLVVPGYLASVFIIQPTTAMVIVVEAMLTYAVVAAVSDRAPRWLPWFPLFGRDRFFLILLASVGVRLAMEGGGLDVVAQITGVGVSSDLHSMGLVVVPLGANALSRSGLGVGIPRLAVPLVVTWAILDLVLLRYTNLSLSSFELTYEDLAVDFVGSPKAYILLLCGAWVGSYVNVRWGWDFGGIVVPGLLALCWLQPLRLFATIGEVVVIVVVMRAILATPRLASANLTGGRPAVLAFTIAFIVKFLLAWTLGAAWPGLRATDLFGFGYLLTTLIALRALRFDDLLRPIVASMTSSFVGFLLGSAAGYALFVVWPTEPPAEDAISPGSYTLVDVLRAASVDEGAVPDLALVMDRTRGERVVVGGEGFGAAWLRPEGRPIAVVGVRGQPGMGLAVLATAELLDASAVVLCARPEAACDDAVDAVARRWPVLAVRPGPESLLVGEGSDLGRVDLGTLRRALGDFRLAGEPGALTLVLDPAGRVALADAVIGEEPTELRDTEAWGLLERLDENLFDLSGVRVMDEAVYQPSLDWLTREPYGDASLRVATGVARALGFEVEADASRALLVGPDLRMVLDRTGDGPVLHVPFTREEPHAVDLARVVGAALRAQVLIEDSPPDLRPERYDRSRAAHTAVLRAVDRLGERTGVIAVRGIRDVFDAGAEVALASGRSLENDRDLPPISDSVQDLLDRLDVPAAHYDGASRRLSFLDPYNPARVAVHAGTVDRDQVTLWASTPVRERFRSVEGDHLLSPAVEQQTSRSRRPLQEVSVALVDDPPGERWSGVRAALDELAKTGSAGWLGVARGRASAVGADLRVWCEPSLGCRWAVAQACGAEVCDGVVFPLSGRKEALESHSVPRSPREAMITGTADVAFADLPVEEAP